MVGPFDSDDFRFTNTIFAYRPDYHVSAPCDKYSLPVDQSLPPRKKLFIQTLSSNYFVFLCHRNHSNPNIFGGFDSLMGRLKTNL